MQNSLWRQIQNRPMPLTSSVMRQRVSNFWLYCCSKKFQMLQKNVQSLLEQLQVCIFAKIVFGVRCTLIVLGTDMFNSNIRTKSSRQILQISYMERSNFCMEWSNSCMERSDFWWGRNDLGAKWPWGEMTVIILLEMLQTEKILKICQETDLSWFAWFWAQTTEIEIF